MLERENLIKKCVNRDRKAWDQFVRRYSSLVIKSVRYKLAKYNIHLSKTEYMDIVQEVFLDIWEKNKLTGLKSPECLKSWLSILSLNTTSNYCRRTLFKQDLSSLSLDSPAFEHNKTTSFESILPSHKNTENAINANELTEIIKKEISAFNEKQQLALTLNLFNGQTQKNISRIMNISEGTVATFLKRGKECIQSRLKALKYC